jgi:hypothetical protein
MSRDLSSRLKDFSFAERQLPTLIFQRFICPSTLPVIKVSPIEGIPFLGENSQNLTQDYRDILN